MLKRSSEIKSLANIFYQKSNFLYLGRGGGYAVALEGDLFNTIHIKGMIRSWTDVVKSKYTNNQMVNFVYGALHVYDLPDLVLLIPKDKINISGSVDPDGENN